MESVKIATEWAKEEIFSSVFFILFGLLFLLGTLGFWHWGKTEQARAFIYPTMVCGILLLTIGIGLVYANQVRLEQFRSTAEGEFSTFVQTEQIRAERTIREYERVVFMIIPLLIAGLALLMVFAKQPLWHAICISTITMMAVILLIDSNASFRMKAYHQKLLSVAERFEQ